MVLVKENENVLTMYKHVIGSCSCHQCIIVVPLQISVPQYQENVLCYIGFQIDFINFDQLTIHADKINS